MLFNTYGFVLLFLPIFIVGFCILRRGLFGKTSKELVLSLWIIAGSLVFYGLFGLRNFLVLLVSLLWNGVVAFALSSADVRQKSSLYKKFVLFSGIFADALLLLAFKFAGNVLPIAISFYTFNQIAFIVDVYRGDVVDAAGGEVEDAAGAAGETSGASSEYLMEFSMSSVKPISIS